MFNWNEKYSVGFEEIDLQHQKFFKLADGVIALIGNKSEKSDIKLKAKELYDYAKWHFNTEKTYVSSCNTNSFDDHLADHEAILFKIEVFIDDMDKYDSNFGSELMVMLKDWFLNHILILDKKLYSCIIEKKQNDIIIKDKNL